MTVDITSLLMSALSSAKVDYATLQIFISLFLSREGWKSDSEEEEAWIMFYHPSGRFIMHHRVLPLCICDTHWQPFIVYMSENNIRTIFVDSFNSFEMSLTDQVEILDEIGWWVGKAGFDMSSLSASNILFATN